MYNFNLCVSISLFKDEQSVTTFMFNWWKFRNNLYNSCDTKNGRIIFYLYSFMKFPYILHCKSIIIDFQSPRQIWMSQISQGPPFEIQILQRSLECSQISRSWSWDWQCSQIVHFMPNKFFLRLQLRRRWRCSWRFWRHSGIIWKSGVGNSWSCCHAGWELVLFMVRNICKKKCKRKM